MLEQDFGLRFHFDYVYHDSVYGSHYRVLSYLIYSGTYGKMAANTSWTSSGCNHVMHLHAEFLEPEQLPPMTEKLQAQFDRALNSFKLEPWIESMCLPAEISKKHGLKEEGRVNYKYKEKVMEDIQSKKAFQLLKDRSQIS